jgi:hypothetical protein
MHNVDWYTRGQAKIDEDEEKRRVFPPVQQVVVHTVVLRVLWRQLKT